MRQDTTLRKLEVVGQAVKNLSETLQIAPTGYSVETDRRHA
jgi:uncharacterized protein with HEPN domain